MDQTETDSPPSTDSQPPRGLLARVLPMLTSAVVHMLLLLLLALLTFGIEKKPEMIVIDATSDSEEALEMESFEDFEFTELEAESSLSEMAAEMPIAESLETPLVEVEAVEISTNALTPVASLESMLTGDSLMQEIGGGEGSAFGSAGSGSSGSGGGMYGTGLVGRFFDLKQNRSRQPLPYSGQFPDYIQTMNQIVGSGVSDSVTQNFYEAQTQLYLSQLLIPPATDAQDAPRAFNVEGEVEPRGWFVHYTGVVEPPDDGEWRFVGFFDDMLMVYVNNQPVLDGSWVPMVNVGQGTYDDSLRQEFGGPGVSGTRTAYAGKWIKLKGPAKIDILIGETPGGKMGGLLMCQKKGETYETRADGTPILPLFAVTHAETRRVRQEPFAQAYQLERTPPLWKTVKRKR